MVIIVGASSASSGSTMQIRLNADTGNNYYSVGNTTNAPSSYSIAQFSYVGDYPGDAIPIGKMCNNNTSIVFGYILIDGCNTTGIKSFQASGGANTEEGAEQHRMFNIGGYYNSASTISSVTIRSSTGNLDAGTVYVYTSA
jgi:hypothetical protein